MAIRTDGMLVIDVDGADNVWLRDQPDHQIALGVAPQSLTGNGGRQYFFRQPAGHTWRNTAGRIALRVDTRADGGYVVVPPSVLESGKQYRWQFGCALDVSREDLPEPPAWLQVQLEQAASDTVVQAGDGNPIPGGQRNTVLARLAGSMRRHGMTQAEITAALQRVNADRCQPPLPAREVERIATSIARYAPNQVATALVENHWEQAFGQTPAVQPLSVRDLIAGHPTLREPVIHDLLRRGETMNVISAPKVGKSWLVTDLALSIATGRPWLNTFQTERGDVLLLDNELHRETSAHRIPRVAKARGIPLDAYADHLFVHNMRGQLRDVFTLGPLFENLEPDRYRVIVLDAFYRFMPRDMDENDNGTMADLYNQIDRYADRLGCCFVLIHHTTKGNQSQKSVTDVGAGAGSQSRATDTHLVLRPHEEDHAVVLDAAVRSWAPVEPMCLRWSFPLWNPARDLDPAQLRSEKPKKKQMQSADDTSAPTWNAAQFARHFVTDEPRDRNSIILSARDAGLSGRQTERLLREAEGLNLVHRWYFGSNVPVGFASVPQPQNGEKA